MAIRRISIEQASPWLVSAANVGARRGRMLFTMAAAYLMMLVFTLFFSGLLEQLVIAVAPAFGIVARVVLQIFTAVFVMVLNAGFLYGIARADSGGGEVGDLMAGFTSERMSRLAVLTVPGLLIAAIALGAMALAYPQLLDANAAPDLKSFTLDGRFFALLAVIVPLQLFNLCLTVFALPQVTLAGRRPLLAMLDSLFACMRNFLPLLVLAILLLMLQVVATVVLILVLGLLATILSLLHPFLALVVVAPLIFGLMLVVLVYFNALQFVAWREIFQPVAETPLEPQ